MGLLCSAGEGTSETLFSQFPTATNTCARFRAGVTHRHHRGYVPPDVVDVGEVTEALTGLADVAGKLQACVQAFAGDIRRRSLRERRPQAGAPPKRIAAVITRGSGQSSQY